MLGYLKSLTGDIGVGLLFIDVGVFEESNWWYWCRNVGVGILGLLKSLTSDIGVGMLGLLKSLTVDIGL